MRLTSLKIFPLIKTIYMKEIPINKVNYNWRIIFIYCYQKNQLHHCNIIQYRKTLTIFQYILYFLLKFV